LPPTIPATAGRPQLNASAWYDPATRCWKTWQASFLLDTLEPFSETWPKAGMIVAGEFYPQPKQERRIRGIASGLWQTPTVPNGGRGSKTEMTPTGVLPNGQKRQVGLEHQVKMVERHVWPTPTASLSGDCPAERNRKSPNLEAMVNMLPTPTSRDWKSGTGAQAREGHAPPLSDVVGGKLNPRWVEGLMGWPVGWTDLAPLPVAVLEAWAATWAGEAGRSAWQDGSWEHGIDRTLQDRLPHRADQLKALGNGQVPQVAAMAWSLLTENEPV